MEKSIAAVSSIVLRTATGLQEQKSMDNGIKWMREVGKLDLKLWEKDWLWYEFENNSDYSLISFYSSAGTGAD